MLCFVCTCWALWYCAHNTMLLVVDAEPAVSQNSKATVLGTGAQERGIQCAETLCVS